MDNNGKHGIINRKYITISLYVIVTFGICLLIYHSSSFWNGVLKIVVAVMRPIIFGGLISYILMPLVNRLQDLFMKGRFLGKHEKTSRSLSVLIVVIGVLAALAAGIVITAFMIYKQITDLDLSQIKKMIDSFVSDIQGFIDIINNTAKQYGITIKALNDIPSMTSGIADNITGSSITGLLSSVKGFFVGLVFAIIFSVYFMIDGRNIKRYWWKALNALLPKKHTDFIHRMFYDADKAFSGYIRGQFIDAMLVGVTVSTVMYFIGVPYAFVIGLLTGIGNLIPYVGGLVGFTSVSIICLSTGNYRALVFGCIALAIIMFIDGNIFNPKLLSDNIEVHPLLVIAALIAGSSIGGFLGMLISVPTAAFIKLQFDRYIESRTEEVKKENRAKKKKDPKAPELSCDPSDPSEDERLTD